MSEGLPVPGQGPPSSVWSHMAFVMSKRLSAMADARSSISEESIPVGVYHDAKGFFTALDPVLQDAPLGEQFSSGARSIYMLALEALGVYSPAVERMGGRQSPDRGENKPTLRRFAELLAGLEEPHEFDDDEVRTATELVCFFKELHQMGSQQRYVDATEG